MSLIEIAIEAAYANKPALLRLVEQARQGNELARQTLRTWERWALQHRVLRIRGLFQGQVAA